MYSPINGWTKETIIAKIKSDFKGKSMAVNGACLYRGPNGTKCAVGIFIPDEMYSSGMENIQSGTAVQSILNNFPSLESVMPLNTLALSELQRIHDGGHSFDDMRSSDQILADLVSWIETNVR